MPWLDVLAKIEFYDGTQAWGVPAFIPLSLNDRADMLNVLETMYIGSTVFSTILDDFVVNGDPLGGTTLKFIDTFTGSGDKASQLHVQSASGPLNVYQFRWSELTTSSYVAEDGTVYSTSAFSTIAHELAHGLFGQTDPSQSDSDQVKNSAGYNYDGLMVEFENAVRSDFSLGEQSRSSYEGQHSTSEMEMLGLYVGSNYTSGEHIDDTRLGFDTIDDNMDMSARAAKADLIFGFSGNDYIDGGGGNDFLYGGDDNDTLLGSGGNDHLYGDGGIDILDGGDGDDILDGGANFNTLHGGVGNDALFGADGQSFMYGDAGDDTLYGGGLGDTLYGGADNDLLVGGEVADSLFGGDGNDTLEGGTGADILDGGDGYDVLSYRSAQSAVGIELANGVMQGTSSDSASDAYHDAMAGFEEVLGSDYVDIIELDGSGIVVKGFDGDDQLTGGAGGDQLFGDGGQDILHGGGGDDAITGGDGADELDGGEGNDTLRSEGSDAGTEIVSGGAGNDRIFVEPSYGLIEVSGGTGNDYIGKEGGGNFDEVTDLVVTMGTNFGHDEIQAASTIDMSSYNRSSIIFVWDAHAVSSIGSATEYTGDAAVVINSTGDSIIFRGITGWIDSETDLKWGFEELPDFIVSDGSGEIFGDGGSMFGFTMSSIASYDFLVL